MDMTIAMLVLAVAAGFLTWQVVELFDGIGRWLAAKSPFLAMFVLFNTAVVIGGELIRDQPQASAMGVQLQLVALGKAAALAAAMNGLLVLAYSLLQVSGEWSNECRKLGMQAFWEGKSKDDCPFPLESGLRRIPSTMRRNAWLEGYGTAKDRQKLRPA